MQKTIKELATILLFSIWNNIGNLGYFYFWAWFTHSNMTDDTIMYLLYINHIYIIIPTAHVVFFVREYIKSK